MSSSTIATSTDSYDLNKYYNYKLQFFAFYRYIHDIRRGKVWFGLSIKIAFTFSFVTYFSSSTPG